MIRTTTMILMLSLGVLAGAEDETAERAPIRHFDLETLGELGAELFQRDNMAAAAFDLLLDRHPEAKDQGLGGWLTEFDGDIRRVHIIKRGEEGATQGYVLTLTLGEKKTLTLEPHLGEALPERLVTRLAARDAAVKAMPGFHRGRRYNVEVLDDPDGEGYLVYVLAAHMKAGEVVVGGHTRITVAADGTTVEQVDALSKSLLIIPPQKTPEGSRPVAIHATHLVSGTPIEIHAFLSCMHKRPIMVQTPDGKLWKVDGKSIEEVGSVEEALAPSEQGP